MAKFCTNCGNELKEGQAFCTNCGKKEGEVEVKTTTNNVSNNVNNGTNQNNGLAIAGFVTTLVSTLLCCGAFNLIGLILSIIGLVKAKDYNGNGKGLAIAGIVIFAVVFVLSVICLILIAASGEAMPEIIDELNSL